MASLTSCVGNPRFIFATLISTAWFLQCPETRQERTDRALTSLSRSIVNLVGIVAVSRPKEFAAAENDSAAFALAVRDVGSGVTLDDRARAHASKLQDAWGRALILKFEKGSRAIISCGPNGRFEGGKRDDIVFEIDVKLED